MLSTRTRYFPLGILLGIVKETTFWSVVWRQSGTFTRHGTNGDGVISLYVGQVKPLVLPPGLTPLMDATLNQTLPVASQVLMLAPSGAFAM